MRRKVRPGAQPHLESHLPKEKDMPPRYGHAGVKREEGDEEGGRGERPCQSIRANMFILQR